MSQTLRDLAETIQTSLKAKLTKGRDGVNQPNNRIHKKHVALSKLTAKNHHIDALFVDLTAADANPAEYCAIAWEIMTAYLLDKGSSEPAQRKKLVANTIYSAAGPELAEYFRNAARAQQAEIAQATATLQAELAPRVARITELENTLETLNARITIFEREADHRNAHAAAHGQEVAGKDARIHELEAENQRLQQQLEQQADQAAREKAHLEGMLKTSQDALVNSGEQQQQMMQQMQEAHQQAIEQLNAVHQQSLDGLRQTANMYKEQADQAVTQANEVRTEVHRKSMALNARMSNAFIDPANRRPSDVFAASQQRFAGNGSTISMVGRPTNRFSTALSTYGGSNADTTPELEITEKSAQSYYYDPNVNVPETLKYMEQRIAELRGNADVAKIRAKVLGEFITFIRNHVKVNQEKPTVVTEVVRDESVDYNQHEVASVAISAAETFAISSIINNLFVGVEKNADGRVISGGKTIHFIPEPHCGFNSDFNELLKNMRSYLSVEKEPEHFPFTNIGAKERQKHKYFTYNTLIARLPEQNPNGGNTVFPYFVPVAFTDHLGEFGTLVEQRSNPNLITLGKMFAHLQKQKNTIHEVEDETTAPQYQ